MLTKTATIGFWVAANSLPLTLLLLVRIMVGPTRHGASFGALVLGTAAAAVVAAQSTYVGAINRDYRRWAAATAVSLAVASIVAPIGVAMADLAGYERAGIPVAHALAGLAFAFIQSTVAAPLLASRRRWFIAAAGGWAVGACAVALLYHLGVRPGGSTSLFPGFMEFATLACVLFAYGAITGPAVPAQFRLSN